MSTGKQRPSLPLSHQGKHLDQIIGSSPPTLCSPTEAVQQRPIYIISPEVVYQTNVGTSRYVQQGPTGADPLFAFSFVDNLIVNDESHYTDRIIRERALAILRNMAIVGRGRAYEYGLGNRRAVCGLYPRQIYENALNNVRLECINFNTFNNRERGYARAIAYVNLAAALRRKYGRHHIKLVLGSSAEDNFVLNYATQYFAASFASDRIAIEVAPAFPASKWLGHEGETWYPSSGRKHWNAATRKGSKNEPSWDEALCTLTPNRPTKPFIIVVDTNSVLADRDPKGFPRKSLVGEYVVYASNTSDPNISFEMTEDIVNETIDKLQDANLAPPPGQWWSGIERNNPTLPPTMPTSFPKKWLKKKFVGDPSIRHTLYGPSGPAAQVLLVTADNGMTTATWHYDQPVFQTAEYGDRRKLPLPLKLADMTKYFTLAVGLYETRHQPSGSRTQTQSQHQTSQGIPQLLHTQPQTSRGIPTPSRGKPTPSHGIPTTSQGIPTTSRGAAPQPQVTPQTRRTDPSPQYYMTPSTPYGGYGSHQHLPAYHQGDYNVSPEKPPEKPPGSEKGCFLTCLGRTIAPWTICFAPPTNEPGSKWTWRFGWRPWGCCGGGCCGGGCCGGGCSAGCCSGGCCGGGCCSGCGGGRGDQHTNPQMAQLNGPTHGAPAGQGYDGYARGYHVGQTHTGPVGQAVYDHRG